MEDESKEALNKALGTVFRQIADKLETGTLPLEYVKALNEIFSTAIDLLINLDKKENYVSKYKNSKQFQTQCIKEGNGRD